MVRRRCSSNAATTRTNTYQQDNNKPSMADGIGVRQKLLSSFTHTSTENHVSVQPIGSKLCLSWSCCFGSFLLATTSSRGLGHALDEHGRRHATQRDGRRQSLQGCGSVRTQEPKMVPSPCRLLFGSLGRWTFGNGSSTGRCRLELVARSLFRIGKNKENQLVVPEFMTRRE